MSISDRLDKWIRDSEDVLEAVLEGDIDPEAFTDGRGGQALAALRAVLDLHKPMTMYEHEDCCENDSDDHREERHAEDVVHGGEYFCMDLPTGIVLCAECSRDLDFDGRDYPCPTVRTVTAALGEDAQ